MPVKAGKLGDRIYTADINTTYRWGMTPSPLYVVESNVAFWDQDDAEAFRVKVQALLEEVSNGLPLVP